VSRIRTVLPWSADRGADSGGAFFFGFFVDLVAGIGLRSWGASEGGADLRAGMAWAGRHRAADIEIFEPTVQDSAFYANGGSSNTAASAVYNQPLQTYSYGYVAYLYGRGDAEGVRRMTGLMFHESTHNMGWRHWNVDGTSYWDHTAPFLTDDDMMNQCFQAV
jgi:hypothetical protein